MRLSGICTSESCVEEPMDSFMSFFVEKTKEDYEKSKRQLEYDLDEVNIKLKHRRPSSEIDKLLESKRKLEFQLREVNEELKKLAIKEREEDDRNRREIDRITREHEESFRMSNDRRKRNKERRKEKMKKYGLESSIEASKDALTPCCVIL